MFVNPISSFNVTSNAYRSNNNQSIKSNQQVPMLNTGLQADTVSFGEGNKKKKANPAVTAALLTAMSGVAGGAMQSCAPDYISEMSMNNSTVINLKDYHQCHDSIPIVFPGGKDTVYIPVPGETVLDTMIVEKPVYDTIIIDKPVHDTIWIKDSIYIPKKPHFEINDSINKDIEDFEIPTEGDGDFVWAFTGRNEYLGATHALVFNGFFSNEHKSSFIDHAFEDDDIPAGGDKPTKYYYTRYDISSDYENGKRYVQVYKPAKSEHILPDDKKNGEAGWRYAGSFYVQNASVAETAKLIANDLNGTLKAQYTKNEHRGPGNIYKEWPLDDGSMPKTTIEKVKAYRKDIDNLD